MNKRKNIHYFYSLKLGSSYIPTSLETIEDNNKILVDIIKIYTCIIFFNAELIKNKIFFKKIQRVNITLKLKMSIITYLSNT